MRWLSQKAGPLSMLSIEGQQSFLWSPLASASHHRNGGKQALNTSTIHFLTSGKLRGVLNARSFDSPLLVVAGIEISLTMRAHDQHIWEAHTLHSPAVRKILHPSTIAHLFMNFTGNRIEIKIRIKKDVVTLWKRDLTLRLHIDHRSPTCRLMRSHLHLPMWSAWGAPKKISAGQRSPPTMATALDKWVADLVLRIALRPRL